jgi:hypothetical protein
MHNLVTKRRNPNPSDLLLCVELTEMLFVLGIGKRHSFRCGEADTPGSAYFRHLEGSFTNWRGVCGALLGLEFALGPGPRP